MSEKTKENKNFFLRKKKKKKKKISGQNVVLAAITPILNFGSDKSNKLFLYKISKFSIENLWAGSFSKKIENLPEKTKEKLSNKIENLLCKFSSLSEFIQENRKFTS